MDHAKKQTHEKREIYEVIVAKQGRMMMITKRNAENSDSGRAV